MDDASLARALVAHLQTRNAVTPAHLAEAARHFEAGRLPATALVLAGLPRDVVLDALAVVTGRPRAPAPATWSTDPALRERSRIPDDAWRRAKALPFGVQRDRLLVAFADMKWIDGAAAAALPQHDAFVCLEEDVDAALLAAVGGQTMLDPRAQATLITPPPPLPEQPRPITMGVGSGNTAVFTQTPASAAPIVAKGGGAAVSMDVTRQSTPTTIGPFVVTDLIARGGMGTVYEARDDQGRRAAIKVIHPHLLNVAEVRARFVREAQATQRINHPNIVRVLGVGSEPAYLACEFLEGGTVSRLLQEHRKLPVVVALELFAEMIAGLEAAHAQNIVHRDLKPDNLLLSKDGVLKIADFGIARELDATAMTQTGSTLGTPAYMSPEQARAEQIDQRSDLYTAGVILYELLTGKNPFHAESLGAIVANILRGRAPPLFEVDPSIPDVVEALVASLMSTKRDARPPTASHVLAIVRPLVDEMRRKRPRLVAELLEQPAVAREIVREQANDLVAAARKHLQKGPSHREAAALCLFRAQLLAPDNADARGLLDGLAQEGIAFGASSAKLIELEKELWNDPDDPVLLQRAAHLARQEGNVYKAAIYFRRYLRVRPEDNYVRAQAEKLTVVVATPAPVPVAAPLDQTAAWSPQAGPQVQTGDTVQRIAGHVATGGFVAAAPVAPPAPFSPQAGVPSPAFVEQEPPGVLAALWNVHKTKIIGLVVVAVIIVGGVRAVKGAIAGAQNSINESGASFGTKARKPADADADEIAFKAAREAFAVQNWNEVEKHTTAIIAREASGKAWTMAESLLMRAKARLAQNRALPAVEDLTRIIDRYGGQDQAATEALLRRGQAYVAAGEKQKAKDDFDNALNRTLTQNHKAVAHLERGLIELDLGDQAAARSDLQKAETYTPPSDPTHIRALEALKRLPAASADE